MTVTENCTAICSPSWVAAPSLSQDRLRRSSVARLSDCRSYSFRISSFETSLTPEAAAQAVPLYGPKAALFSAYDVYNAAEDARSAALASLNLYRSNGGIVALDSGNYEATRKRDPNWTVGAFHEVLSLASYDFAFCVDEVLPTNLASEVSKGVCQATERDREFTSKSVIPIVHAPMNVSTGAMDSALLPQIMQDVCRELHPELIAVPERELGDGLFERAKTVHQIRQSLNALGSISHCPFWVLGICSA